MAMTHDTLPKKRKGMVTGAVFPKVILGDKSSITPTGTIFLLLLLLLAAAVVLLPFPFLLVWRRVGRGVVRMRGLPHCLLLRDFPFGRHHIPPYLLLRGNHIHVLWVKQESSA